MCVNMYACVWVCVYVCMFQCVCVCLCPDLGRVYVSLCTGSPRAILVFSYSHHFHIHFLVQPDPAAYAHVA